jgi:hypothetical protein
VESVGSKKSAWELVPPLSLDGTYTIEVRGVDVFGNVSVPKTLEFVIDQLPPTVGGVVISYGALPLYADGGIVTVMEGLEYEVVLYEEGGADEITIEIANLKFSNSQMGSQGLWRSLIKFEEVGEFVSEVKAVDGAGNETEREWVKFKVMPRLKILQNGVEQKEATIRVMWLDPTTKKFQKWEQDEYGVKGLVLPRGEYYLEVEGQRVISQKIVLENTTHIGGSWEIGQASWWEQILGIRRMAELHYMIKPLDHYSIKPLSVGREQWIGKKSIVYIGTPELPWYGESKRRAEEWASREEGQLVEIEAKITDPYGLLPQVYLVNDRGDTQDFKEGVWER